MSTNMQLLQEVKTMATKIRHDNQDSGTHYLLGYMWETLTPKQQNEIAKSFRNELSEVSEL